MRYSIPQNINGLDINDGILYFSQRVEEMLYNFTIDLFRTPLLNTHGLVQEYCFEAKRVALGIVKDYHRKEIFEELIASINKDIVLKENWGIDNIERITKSFGSSSQQDKDNTVSYLKATFGYGRYYHWCVQTILS